jgi:hypothetical protein
MTSKHKKYEPLTSSNQKWVGCSHDALHAQADIDACALSHSRIQSPTHTNAPAHKHKHRNTQKHKRPNTATRKHAEMLERAHSEAHTDKN